MMEPAENQQEFEQRQGPKRNWHCMYVGKIEILPGAPL
jgi:hypothetical protein